MELKIKIQKNNLNTLQLFETINVHKLEQLIESKFLQTVKHWDTSYEKEKEYLIKMRHLVNDDGLLPVSYYKPKIGIGRVQPRNNMSMCTTRKEIRHTLCNGVYVDIDIDNCHPTLLLQICKKNKLKCKYLEKYVNDRKTYLELVQKHYKVNRDQAKELFIRLAYLGSLKNWKLDNKVVGPDTVEFLTKYTNELAIIAQAFCDDNPEILKEVTEKNKDDPTKSIKGGVLSTIMQEYEFRVLSCCFNYLQDTGKINGNAVLCYDGIMILLKFYDPSLLNQLQAVVKSQLGFDVSFSTKAMDLDLSEKIKSIVPKTVYNLTFEHTLISKRYLLPKDVPTITTEFVKVTKEDHDIVLQEKIIEFFNDDSIKSFNLKSPYDTGKTQMIKRIIDTYDPKRILWLSYRKTLTNDILGNFEEEYNFKDYQKHEYSADRLIVQLESVYKIGYEKTYFDDGKSLKTGQILMKYPEYDLVIMDEAESILSHFDSPTFKGNSKEVFHYVQNVIQNSKKIISLDGDMGNRLYTFIASFGKYINVVNDIKINKKKFVIDEDEKHFLREIQRDLMMNKKVVIVSMSSKKCDELAATINYEHDKKKKVLVYTGSSSDKSKEDFKKVLEKWSKCDVLIYSPTCESGVNFDMKYFDKMYGIINDRSTTPRAFFQMLARVRKFESNEVLILDKCFDTKDVNPNKPFFHFDEVKESILLLENFKLETSDVVQDGKVYKTTNLSTYDINYIYNGTEKRNASVKNWLSYFHKLALIKGHNISYLRNKPSKTDNNNDIFENDYFEEEVVEDMKMTADDLLVAAENIDDEQYKELLTKQKKNKATSEDKLKIKKHATKLSLGLDELSTQVLNVFDLHSVQNFTSLIDIDNIKKNDDNQTLEAIDRSKTVKQLIQEIGFKHIFDKKEIDQKTFLKTVDNIIKTNKMFTNMSNTRIRFGLDKDTHCKTNKAFLGFVNTLIKRYSLKIKYVRKRVKDEKEKQAFYRLDQLHCINELVEYKVLKRHILHDSDNIRTKADTESYKHLVDLKKIEEVNALIEKSLKESLE